MRISGLQRDLSLPLMSPPLRKSLDRHGAAISYLEWANSRPVLHFAHANGFNAQTYLSLLEPLAAHFHIVASDLRGHGLTTLPAMPGLSDNWAVYGRDLAEFLDCIHPGPMILAGHSMGAIASLMVAAAHPHRVRALVLCEPVLVPAMAYALMRLARLAGIGPPVPDLAERAAKRREIFPSFDAALAAYRGRGAFKTWPDRVLRDYLHGGTKSTGNGTEIRLACSPAWESENFQASPRDIAKLARRVRCPLTLIVGENGTARDREVEVVMRGHGHARLIKVPGTTHFLPMERPDIVREELERIARHH
jgi:pimeloyl-ACP methyl ester carboxylesterase